MDKGVLSCGNGRNGWHFDHVRLSPHEQIGSHWQPSWELSLVVCGSGRRRIGDREEPFSAGEVVLIPPRIPHCWRFDALDTDTGGNIENMTLVFENDFLTRLAMLFPETEGMAERLRGISGAVRFADSDADAIAVIMGEMSRSTDVGRVPLLIRLLTMLSESEAAECVGRGKWHGNAEERMNRLRIYVICNLKRQITLDDAARHVGMNRSSFCVFFKQQQGCSFFTYVNRMRIDNACRLLAESDMTVAEACFESGFGSVHHFNRLFRRTVGTTPTGYRTARRKE